MAFAVDRYLRAARRRADVSQRELAAAAGVSHSTVGRAEKPTTLTTVQLFERLLAAMALRLLVVDSAGVLLEPEDGSVPRDGAGRRFPPYVDLRDGAIRWWGDGWPMFFDVPRPRYTFDRCRDTRDWYRERAADKARPPNDCA